MNFQQLRSVRETVRCGFNLTEVAHTLHTSQPGVSRQIRELEDELGIALFVRAGKRLTGMTEPGAHVLPIIERILLDSNNLRQAGQEFVAQQSGTLSIAATHSQARYALPTAVQEFRLQFPNLKLHLHQGSPRQVAEMLLSCRMRSMIGSTCAPGSVMPVRRLPARTNSAIPSSSSSSRIWRLTPGCEVCSVCATSVKLKPQRTVSRTERSCWKFMQRRVLNNHRDYLTPFLFFKRIISGLVIAKLSMLSAAPGLPS